MDKSKKIKNKAKDIINNVKDDSNLFNKKEMETGKGMSILSYIIPLIPYFAEKKNKYVQYHAKQGMNLFVLAIAYGVIYNILTSIIKVNTNCGYGYWGELAAELGTYCKVTPWWVTIPLSLIGLCITVLCIMGIINVCNNKAKELPIVNKFKIFK